MRASKLLHRISIFINYAKLFKINEKCYFSVISWPILILFGLSDRASKFVHRILKFINYANLCIFIQNQLKLLPYFSISQRILIRFVLSDRAWLGLRNFYTELWNALIMQIHANLFKINEKCHLSSIQKSQQICTWGGDVFYASRNLLSTCCISNTQPCMCMYFEGLTASALLQVC